MCNKLRHTSVHQDIHSPVRQAGTEGRCLSLLFSEIFSISDMHLKSGAETPFNFSVELLKSEANSWHHESNVVSKQKSGTPLYEMYISGARNVVLQSVMLGSQMLRTLQRLSSCKWTLETFTLCNMWLALLNINMQTFS